MGSLPALARKIAADSAAKKNHLAGFLHDTSGQIR
jgi:hypothetical protein